MANDRLRLRCKFCDDPGITVAKYYPTWFTGTTENGALEMYKAHAVAAHDYIAKHSLCNPYCGGMDLNGEPGFVLETESTARTESTDA
jgi:hypothetical protein